MTSHMQLRLALLFAGGLAIGCDAPRTDDTGASLSASPGARVDSARAAQLALDTMRKESPTGVRVVEVKRDAAGYLVTLFPDPLVPGGGGRVQVTLTGRVSIVERFQ